MNKKPVKASSSKAALELRCKLFAEAYLANGGNKTQAAIAAGCPTRSAHTQGQTLFKHHKVQELIEERTSKTLTDLQITTERILKERARMAFYDPRKLFCPDGRRIPIHELDADTAAAVAAFDIGDSGVKIRMADKNASLTALERYKGMAGADGSQPKPDAPMSYGDIEAARAIAFILAKAAHYLKRAENPHQLPDPERQG
mgnify:CR=1 FL=1